MDEKANLLEERLIDFAVKVIEVVEALPETRAGRHVAGQLVRSGTSPAPNYAEARAAESREDFVHKMRISLKELRESLIWLKITERKPLLPRERVKEVIAECDALVSIFVKSVHTADRNNPKRPKQR